MYCERCNIDFPEGLRYCKWCGNTLLSRPRVTSQLQSCPSCSTAIQPDWTYCKVCGARLTSPIGGQVTVTCSRCGSPLPSGSTDCVRCSENPKETPRGPHTADHMAPQTAVIVHCSGCGEALDAGAIYCKGCGEPVYSPSSTYGESSLLCRECESYSPVGSMKCKVCGSAFGGIESISDSMPTGIVDPGKNLSHTLPDLAERLAEPEDVREPAATDAPASPPTDENSGARTLVFKKTGEIHPPDSSNSERPNTPQGTRTFGGGGFGNDTVLTSPIEKGRSTNLEDLEPRKEDGFPGATTPSAELELVTASDIEPDPGSVPGEGGRGDATGTFGSLVGLNDPGEEESAGKRGTVIIGSDFKQALESEAEQVDDAATHKENEPDYYDQEAQTAPFAFIHEGVESSPPPPKTAERGVDATPPASPKSDPLKTRPNKVVKISPVEPPPVAPVEPVEIVEPVVPQVPQPQPGQGRRMAVISIAVALLVLGGVAFAVWWFLVGGRPAPDRPVAQTPPASTPARPETPVAPTSPPPAQAAPEGMVLVPAGTYVIGRDDGDPLEKPQRSVTLPAFYIDATEVTNGEYRKFVEATGRSVPDPKMNPAYAAGKDDWPVTGVTWQDAADYAVWAGKRLPSEAEWEAAARGADGRIYPWGNDWRPRLANIGTDSIKPVGSYKEGASPLGALDMIGNVWEWTADEFQLYPGGIKSLPSQIKLEPGVTYRVIRGGAFDGREIHDASYRGLVDASQAYPKTGFRCVK